jgi:ankyrin repeat protein
MFNCQAYYISNIPLMCFALYILFKAWSALHIAARYNNVEAAKLLLLNVANVNATATITVSISVS